MAEIYTDSINFPADNSDTGKENNIPKLRGYPLALLLSVAIFVVTVLIVSLVTWYIGNLLEFNFNFMRLTLNVLKWLISSCILSSFFLILYISLFDRK